MYPPMRQPSHPPGSRCAIRLIGILTPLFALSCGNDEPTPPSSPIATISIEPDTLVLVSGEFGELNLSALDEQGQSIDDPTVMWESRDTAIATIDVPGRVRAHSPGRTEIVVSATALADTAAILVTPALVAIVAGSLHTCGVATDGAAFCWGEGAEGRLGTGSSESQLAPAAVQGDPAFEAIEAGLAGTCALEVTASVFCWGWYTIVGVEHPGCLACPTPIRVAGLNDVLQLAVGWEHACALTPDGAAHCWGRGEFGKLGHGSEDWSLTPAAVSGGVSFSRIGLGRKHSCGVATSLEAYCWGSNTNGQLGIGDETVAMQTVPAEVVGGIEFAAVGAGNAHSCGLAMTGRIHCWGANDRGQLGVEMATASSPEPVEITGGNKFVDLAVGWLHNCALTEEGRAYCWGANTSGQLGDGGTADHHEPLGVAGDFVFVTLTAGGGHTCGLTASGAAYCWGLNGDGQIGDGTTTSRPLPTRVTAPLGAADG